MKMVRVSVLSLARAFGIGAVLEKELDEVQMVHVRLRYWKVAAFDIAVVGGQIQRRPVAFVGEIHVRAAFEQIFRELVMPIVGRGQ